MSDAKQRTAKPGDLLSQWWTLGAIAADRRTSGRHLKAGWVIINSYWQKHGNGRASLRFIERATGMDRKTVIKACRELDEWGHAARATGVGSRPSEYVPRWVTSASGVQTATTNDDDLSGVQMTTGVVVESAPLEGASGVQMTTESYLPEPAYMPASGELDDDCAAPTAPPLAGLSAATAGTAQEELPSARAKPTFELCYRTYDCLKGKKEARAAWDALPAEVDRAAVIRVAAAWQASWDAQGKPDAPRKHLATWLREERYDEDPPRGFQKVERAKTKTKDGPTTSTTAKPAQRAVRTTATTARITSVDVVKTECATELRLEFTDGDGAVWDYIIPLEHDVQEKQEDGQRLLSRLGRATGLERIDDLAELLGRTVILTGDDAAFAAPTTRPDDEPPLPVKPEPERLANPAPTTMPNESPRDFAARMATSLGAGWPAGMGAEYEYEEDDEAA